MIAVHSNPSSQSSPFQRARGQRGAVASLAVATLLAFAGLAHAADLRLDADEAARRAVAASHTLQAGRAAVSGAEAAVSRADAEKNPVLSLAAAAARRSAVPELRAPLDGPGAPPVLLFPNIQNTASFGLDLRQTLYAGGAVQASRAASRQSLAATAADLRAADADLVLTARVAYWRAVAAQASVAAAERRLDRARRLVSDTTALKDAGLAVEADVLGARARLAQAQLDVIRSQADADTTMAELRSLLGIAMQDPVELADREPLGVPPAPDELATLIATARTERPELVGASARIAAATAQQTVAAAPAKPSLSAAAQWEVARPNQRYLPQRDEWNDSWSVGLAARWTLWDAGRVKADVRVAQSRAQELTERAGEIDRRIVLAVEQARIELESARAGVTAATAATAAAQARFDASEDRYKAGVAAVGEVLDAEADLARAESDSISIHAAAWTAQARMERAVGR